MDNTISEVKKQTPLVIAAFIIIITGMMYAESIINPLLMAFFMSIICAQPIQWLKNKKIPSGLAVFIVIIGIFAIYVGFFELVSKSISLFMQDAPKYEQNLKELTNSARQFFNERGINISLLGGASVMDPAKIMQYTAQVFGQLSEIMSREITFLFLTIFLLTEIESIAIKLKVIAKSTGITLSYLEKIGDSIRHYLSIKTLTSLITGVLIAVCLAIVGVDYPILWGLVAFLLNYIPNIGSIIAAIPAVAFALIQMGFGGALWTIVIFVAINMGVGNVLEPKLMGKGLGLSTFIIFLSLIFWGFVLSTVGMFLSVPLMMTIKIILENNPQTKWVAIMLGTEDEADAALKEK